MSHGVLPPRIPVPVSTTLTSWAEEHLNSLFKAANDKAFDTAFSNTFTRGTTYTLNGKQVSEADYKKHLKSLVIEGGKANVTYSGVVESLNTNDEKSGAVGLFVHATESSKFIVIGIHETENITASFNLYIEVPIYHGHEPGHKESAGDSRRVVSLNEVSAVRTIV